jgi:hypothetical protein
VFPIYSELSPKNISWLRIGFGKFASQLNYCVAANCGTASKSPEMLNDALAVATLPNVTDPEA